MSNRLLAASVVLCLGIGAAACGDDDDDDGGGATSGPVSTEEVAAATTTPVTEEEAPATSTADTEADEEEEAATTTPSTEDEAPADVDPSGVARIAYDLVGQTRGGFQWDPSKAASSTGETGVQHWVYGGLMRPAPDGSLVPDLAEQARIVDPNTIEIVIREGLTLPDGSPLDAALVKTVLETNLAMQGVPAFGAEFFKLSEIEVVDSTTLNLTIPDGTAPSWYDTFLAGPETVIVPPGTDFNMPAGAGPYRVVEYRPGELVVMEKNPDYWDADNIRVAGVELVNTPDTVAATGALGAGQIDWARIDFASKDAVGSDLEVTYTPDPVLLTMFVICKTDEPFSNEQVRQALSMAIDRDAINEVLFGGEGAPAWDLWPEGHRYHNPELDDVYAYDPDAAQQLLADAGYPDGFTFDAIPIPVAGMPEVAQIVQQMYSDIGVTMNIVATQNYVEDFINRKLAPLGLVPSTGAGGIGKLRQWVGDSIGNTCAWNDPELNALAAELQSVSGESDEAIELWHEIQAKVVGEALSIFVMFQPRVAAFDGDHLGDVENAAYPVPVPDLYNMYVKA